MSRDDSLSIGDIVDHSELNYDVNDPYKTLTQIMDHITINLATCQMQIDKLTRQMADMRDTYTEDMTGLNTKNKYEAATARALLDISSVTMQSVDRVRAVLFAEIAAIKHNIAANQKQTSDRLATLERETRGMFSEYLKRRHHQTL